MNYYHALIRHELADLFDGLPADYIDEIEEKLTIMIVRSSSVDVVESVPWYSISRWQWWHKHFALWKSGALAEPLLDSLLPFVQKQFASPEQILQDSALRAIAAFLLTQETQEAIKPAQILQNATPATAVLPDGITVTTKQDITNNIKGSEMKIVERGVTLVSLGLWGVIGFLFWVPLLFRTTASFAGLILYYTITNQSPTHLHVSLDAAINFYARGFQMISSTFNRKSNSDGSGAALFPTNLNRLALEMAWVLLFWGITYYLSLVRH